MGVRRPSSCRVGGSNCSNTSADSSSFHRASCVSSLNCCCCAKGICSIFAKVSKKQLKKISVQRQGHYTGHRDAIYALCAALQPGHFFTGGAEGYIVEWDRHKPDGQ